MSGEIKHIIELEGSLTDTEYERLKKQIADLFGEGNAILLEGGAKYRGVTSPRRKLAGFDSFLANYADAKDELLVSLGHIRSFLKEEQ